MTKQYLKDFFEEKLSDRDISVERLAQKTGVAERHIEAILSGDFKKLPAAPYVRGYLIKLARALDLDENEILLMYRQETTLRTSGAKDLLPSNRYKISSRNPRWIMGGVLGALILMLIIFGITRLLSHAALLITNPILETSTVSINIINLTGRVNPGDKLLIDGEETTIDVNGNFASNYTLEPGLNRIEFVARRLLGKGVTVVRQVVYEATTTPQSGGSKKEERLSTTTIIH